MGIRTATKIIELNNYNKPISVYGLSEPIMIDGNKSSYIIGGEENSPDLEKRQVFFLCEKDGSLIYFVPVIDFEGTIDEAFKEEGYTICN